MHKQVLPEEYAKKNKLAKKHPRLILLSHVLWDKYQETDQTLIWMYCTLTVQTRDCRERVDATARKWGVIPSGSFQDKPVMQPTAMVSHSFKENYWMPQFADGSYFFRNKKFKLAVIIPSLGWIRSTAPAVLVIDLRMMSQSLRKADISTRTKHPGERMI